MSASDSYNVYVTHYFSTGLIAAKADITSVAAADIRGALKDLRTVDRDVDYDEMDIAEANIKDRCEAAAHEIMQAADIAVKAQLAAIAAEEISDMKKRAKEKIDGVD